MLDVAMDLRFASKGARTRRMPRAPFRIECTRVQINIGKAMHLRISELLNRRPDQGCEYWL